MSLKTYKNFFIRSVFSDSNKLECFDLKDEFYKEFVKRNKGYMLYMLRPLRDVINSIIKSVHPIMDHIKDGYIIGYNEYNVIKISIIMDCFFDLKKPKCFSNAILKVFEINFIENKTILTAQVTVSKC